MVVIPPFELLRFVSMARCKHSPVPVSTGHRSADGLGIDSPWAIWSAAGIIMLMALVAYHNSFSGPFVFDDVPAIVASWSSVVAAP
jgi:hypothetical protein